MGRQIGATPLGCARRRLPPFAKSLVEARRNGLSPARRGTGQVAVTLGWNLHATSGLPRIVLPENETPDHFDWKCLSGLSVLIQCGDGEEGRAADLAKALLADGVALINLIHIDALHRGAPDFWQVFLGDKP